MTDPEQVSAPEVPSADTQSLDQTSAPPTPADAASIVEAAEQVAAAVSTPEAATLPTGAEEEEAPQSTFKRRVGPNYSVDLLKHPFRPLPANVRPSWNESVALMPVSVTELNALSDDYKNTDLGQSPHMAKWFLSVNQGTAHMMRGDAFNSTLNREGAHWRQSLKAEEEEVAAGRPKFTDKTEGSGKLVGPQAVMKIRGLLGLGTVARIPLWHSGLHLTFKAPSEIDLLELERRIADDKVILGRITNGTIFSNNAVYLNGHIIDFALSHVYEATYRQVPPLELKKLIKITDLPQLTWGLLCAIYPDGYQYRQPCVFDPTKCTHVVEEIIDLNKLSWVDNSAFTDAQRRHMVQRTAKFTDEQLAAYQQDHDFIRKFGTFELRPGLTMVMKVPTLAEHEDLGRAWVDSVIERTDSAFDGRLAGEERNRRIMEMASASTLRQYGQWVGKFVLNIEGEEDQIVIDDPSTIEATLSDLTGQPDVYTKFFDSIEQFINNCTVSIIAVPRINCPNCENPMTPEEKAHPHLTTLDVGTLFFTLLDQRTSRILAQS